MIPYMFPFMCGWMTIYESAIDKILMVASEAIHGPPPRAPGWTKGAGYVITSD